MDQVTHAYDSTVTESPFRFSSSHPQGQHEDLTGFMLSVVATLDLHKLMSLYYQQLAARLPLSAVKLVLPENNLSIGSSDEKDWHMRLDCPSLKFTSASIEYSFYEKLSLSETGYLQQLHRYFQIPLNNAIEHQQVKSLASRDHLTRLGNRQHYNESLGKLISQAKRFNSTFGLLILDLDNFKHINDSLGHQRGDEVLRTVATVFGDCLRDTDSAFRWGGDEFCCLLPNSDSQGNQRIGDRIRQAFAANAMLAELGVSCSIGSANYQAGDDAQSMLTRADEALLTAKQGGRDCFKAA